MPELYTEPILFTGASGRLAGKAIDEMLQTYKIPPQQLEVASRSPDKLTRLAQLGVDVRYADYNNPESLEKASAGVKRALLLPTISVTVPGARLREHLNAVEAFAKSGVERVVFISFYQFNRQSPVPYAEDYWRPAELITAKGMALTRVEDNWYMNNWHMYLSTLRATGEWLTCTQGRRANQVERDDCARSAAAVLATQGHEGTDYVIAGPESLTAAEMAAIASDVFSTPDQGGRTLRQGVHPTDARPRRARTYGARAQRI